MNYQEAVEYLDAHIGYGMHPGPERVGELLDLMGHPQQSYPIIHVAGSNGKTSTSRIASMLLVAHGLTTGTFTSPHLERVEERLALNGVDASHEQFAEAVSDVAAFADLYNARTGVNLSYFELTTAAAFAWFAAEAAAAAVVEVGLGGRLDATNAATGQVAIVTSISLEHREYLGDTIGAIASEKAAIAKPGSTVVTGHLEDDARRAVARRAAEVGAPLFQIDKDFGIDEAELGIGGWLCEVAGIHWSYPDVFLPLRGRHQTANLAVAVAATECLLGRSLDPQAVIDGAAAVRSPGRMELFPGGPMVLLDGAHNTEGFQILADALSEEFPSTKWVLVFGTMNDKEPDAMFRHLRGRVTKVVCTAIDNPRSFDPAELAAIATDALSAPAEHYRDPREALARATVHAGPDGAVLVAGSLYLVGAVRAAVLGSEAPQRNER